MSGGQNNPNAMHELKTHEPDESAVRSIGLVRCGRCMHYDATPKYTEPKGGVWGKCKLWNLLCLPESCRCAAEQFVPTYLATSNAALCHPAEAASGAHGKHSN